ncbi:class I SAM-dependent methyltransferase [Christensenella intestinihominis]|uniref:class I SAM-dependent methyltransferase n=1 Tax=Christensenella intestinihominis TaxID=1851429 RepID=UPI00082E7402|nr:class I SAM-dependent methyltransferase [Christensenella intestinihominis]
MPVDFERTAEYYDAMYGEEDAYRREAGQVYALAQEYGACGKLLDIACGTGLEAKYLSRYFSVTGVDLSRGMLEIAQKNVPGVRFMEGDMFALPLEETFDIAVNLYGSIGFAKDREELAAACREAARCLKKRGLFILTPWSTRETFAEGMLADSGERDGLFFCRMEAVRRDGPRHAEVVMKHLVGRNGEIREFFQTQEITLFSEKEYRGALESAGFRIVSRLTEQEFRMGAFVCVK